MTTNALQAVHIPDEWHDHDLLTFEQLCDLIRVPARTVRDWRRPDILRWHKFPGTGRLYITVGETRRFLTAVTKETNQRPGPTTTAPSSRAARLPQPLRGR